MFVLSDATCSSGPAGSTRHERRVTVGGFAVPSGTARGKSARRAAIPVLGVAEGGVAAVRAA
jgi:hypothetical protein